MGMTNNSNERLYREARIINSNNHLRIILKSMFLTTLALSFAAAIPYTAYKSSTLARPTPAQHARLIGECDGVIYAGLEEDGFPENCTWIEPIRVLD